MQKLHYPNASTFGGALPEPMGKDVGYGVAEKELLADMGKSVIKVESSMRMC